ncbi:hypothetical protein ASZ90_004181 [hydrocarbon metagenome]|uniref:Uncharacterized protein n=1 Tax=hydrocarbon metagenome TaxID=938273 RepID=A0A0W8FYI3_9ZZZZ
MACFISIRETTSLGCAKVTIVKAISKIKYLENDRPVIIAASC